MTLLNGGMMAGTDGATGSISASGNASPTVGAHGVSGAGAGSGGGATGATARANAAVAMGTTADSDAALT